MRNFKSEIRRFALQRLDTTISENRVIVKSDESTGSIALVMQEFYRRTKLGVETYNEVFGLKKLSVFMLPGELIQLLLNRMRKEIGFCLTTDRKIVLIFEDDTGQILVLGKRKENYADNEFILSKAIQLIRISYEKLTGKALIYKDNTGSLLDIDEVIIQIIKWAVSS